jgi:hypothetical protein
MNANAYANATPYTRVSNKFEHFLEDLDCVYCANYSGRSGHGCGRTKCEFQDLRDDCIANNKIKRKRGWNRWEV